MSERDIGRAAREIAEAFMGYREALRGDRMAARNAAFAALCLAGPGADIRPRQAAERVRALSRELRKRGDIRIRAHGAVRDAAAAMLLAAGRGADDLARAQAAVRDLKLQRWANTLLAASLPAAVSETGLDRQARRRFESIRAEFPHKWWRASRIADAQAVSLALRGVEGRQARARMERIGRGLQSAGLRAGRARKAAPAAIGFDPDPAILAANFASLRDGRRAERRLRWFDDPGRAALAAAAPDAKTLHAALAPMLDAARTVGWTQAKPVRAAVARGLALAALGKGDPAASVADLMAIIAAETAAAAGAAAAASGGGAAAGGG